MKKLLTSIAVAGALFALSAGMAFASDTNSIVLNTANRLVTLQNANGSWDWVVTDATGPTANTYYNVTGVTAQELLDAYALNHSATYLTAAENAGNYIAATPISTSQRQNGYNAVFLYNLATASGNATYATDAAAILNSIFTQGNYWSVNNGNNCSATTGCTAAELLAADESYRGAPPATPDGIVPWDLESYVQAEIDAGNTSMAGQIQTQIDSYLAAPAYISSTNDYSLGLSSGVRADLLTGASDTSSLAKLDTAQAGNGSFDASIQPTAYALMALLAAHDSHASMAASYLNTNFTYTDGSGTYNGWKESNNNEYAEIDSEAAHALSATLPAVTTTSATAITTTNATLNGTNGPLAAGQESFWVSTSSINTSSPNIPAGVYSTPVLPGIAAGATFSDPLSLVTTNGIVTGGNPGNMPAITPNTTYYFVAWANIGGTWYPGGQLSVMTSALAPSVTTNSATAETTTGATLNGTDGPVGADNTSFWWGTTPITGTLTPGGNVAEFPATNWSHDSGLGSVSAGGTFNEPLTGLTPGQTYYFVAWVQVGGIWYPGQILSLVVPVASASCPVGTVLSASSVETDVVNSNSGSPTVGATILTSGKSYVLESSGTWENGGINVADTMYATLDNWTTYQEGYDVGSTLLGPNEFNLEVNGAFVNWGPYSSTHNYSYLYTGTGAKASFMVFDGNSNSGPAAFNSSWYGDNAGSLSVAVYSCNPQLSPSVTTNAANPVAQTTATVNGTNGPVNAADTSFWLGTTLAGPFTSSATPASELPGGWAGVDSLTQLANAPFSHAYTGLTPSTEYYFAAWAEVGGMWYPGAVLNFTTSAAPVLPPTPANACGNLSSAPTNYTLKKGTAGNGTYALAPYTMFVGMAGNPNITGSSVGNYILCLSNGNATVNLGNGNDTVVTGNGNETITVGVGNSVITTGNGNSKITAGTGTDTITVGNGNNTINGGGGSSACTVGKGNNTISGCTH